MVPILLFLTIALLFGSFANVCIYRIPRGESIVWPASHCPRCGKTIRWYHNIPILSFLFLRGRCADCGRPISWCYPLVEALLLVLWSTLVWQYPGRPALWGIGGLLALYLLVIGAIDLRLRIIPDVLSFTLLAAGMALSPVNSLLGPAFLPRLINALAGASLGFALMWSTAVLGRMAFKRHAMGGGDIKLMAALGAFLGWKGVLATLVLGSLLGSLAALTLLCLKRIKRRSRIPFGPFLALGAWICWLKMETIDNLWFY